MAVRIDEAGLRKLFPWFTVLGLIVINPSLESVGEGKVTTSNYDAEFGATAGVVSAQTKSGTNTIHGSVFEFLRNNVMQARNPFTQSKVRFVIAMFTDTPTATTVVTPRLRSTKSSSVPEKGERPCRRASTTSESWTSTSGTISVAGEPGSSFGSARAM